MDFEKLRDHDPAEWRSVFNALRGVAKAGASCFAGSLTESELEDAEITAVETACDRIKTIEPSENRLRAWVYWAARNKADDIFQKKKRRPEGYSDSLEKTLEEYGVPKSLQSAEIQPDNIAQNAERTVVIFELLTQLSKNDADLLWALVVEETPQKIVAEQHGRGEKSVGNWKNQACARLAKLLRSDPRAVQLLKELELDHYIE